MKEKVILKSAHPEEYGDLEIVCRVISNDQIGAYLQTISDDKKHLAYKNGKVDARLGKVGEVVSTVLKVTIDGREYILSEEKTTVQERPQKDGTVMPDVVVKNISSTSNEEYVVKASNFAVMYYFDGEHYVPECEPRLLTEVPEDLIIITAWGAKAICLKGSFIVTYNANANDYNTLERGAYLQTYQEITDDHKLKLS